MTRDERDQLRTLIDQARRARLASGARLERDGTPRRRGYWADCERLVQQMRAERKKAA